jgi:hypothetical protein
VSTHGSGHDRWRPDAKIAERGGFTGATTGGEHLRLLQTRAPWGSLEHPTRHKAVATMRRDLGGITITRRRREVLRRVTLSRQIPLLT